MTYGKGTMIHIFWSEFTIWKRPFWRDQLG